MATLTLDLATMTGWALSSGQSGVVSWKGYTHDYAEVDRAFRLWLSDMISENGVTEVVVEPPVVRGAASVMLIGLYWSAMAVAFLHGCRRRDADSNKVRTHILGRDRLKEIRSTPIAGTTHKPTKHTVKKRLKAAVVEWAKAQGHSPATDDEADALAILAWVKEAA